MNISYCLPIIATRKNDVLRHITEQKNTYRFFEVWIEYVEDLDKDFIPYLAKELDERLILVFRRKELEKPKLSLKKQQALIAQTEGTNVFIDIDFIEQWTLLQRLEGKPTKLILSYHNYRKTPQEIGVIVDDMLGMHPTILKVSTLCRSEQDAIRLLQLQQTLKEEKQRHIVLGMGEYGTITRVYGTLWGNAMIFAPLAAEASSAPGQLTREQLEKIFTNLSYE